MPWKPSYEGEFPTLGWLVGEWIEHLCIIPDGDSVGEPFKLYDWQWELLAWHYRLRPDADPRRPKSAWQYLRSQLVEPQKKGKSPTVAAIVCAEAAGPVVFDGWDANGQPVGRPWSTPWIQLAAASESQVANTWRALQPMIERGPLANWIPDTGESRINLPGGGRIEPTTASGKSRLGQRVTFAVMDETQSWTDSNGGVTLSDTVRRNLAGVGGRSIETTNAPAPEERSVAQLTQEEENPRVYIRHKLPNADLSIHVPEQRREALLQVYEDSAQDNGGHIDLDRLDAEIIGLLNRDPGQAERFYLNRKVSGDKVFVPTSTWADRLYADTLAAKVDIAVGFDGSINEDMTALCVSRMDDGLLVPINGWQRGEFDDPTVWEVPRAEVHAEVDELFASYNVCLFYGDPHEWRSELALWSSKYGGKSERVREFPTNSLSTVGPALDQFRTDARTGALRHDGAKLLADHVANARVEQRGRWTVITKEAERSPLKIDMCMAAVIAYAARNFARENKMTGEKRKSYVYTR